MAKKSTIAFRGRVSGSVEGPACAGHLGELHAGKMRPRRNANVSVVVVDAYPIFREGLRQVIKSGPEFSIVGEAGEGTSALNLIGRQHPEVLLVDLEIPGMDGLELSARARRLTRRPEIILFTPEPNEPVFHQAIECGVKGYLLKGAGGSELLQALRTVSSGDYYLSPLIVAHLLRQTETAKGLFKLHPGLEDLTRMEWRILRLISENKSIKEIAQGTSSSYYTVLTHRRNICKKLKLKGSQPLLVFATAHKTHFMPRIFGMPFSELGGGHFVRESQSKPYEKTRIDSGRT